MTTKRILVRASRAATMLAAAATLLAGDARAQTLRATEIRFNAHVQGSGGQVICALFRESGWLKKPVLSARSALRDHESSCVFTGVETGMYAIVAFHDANGNGNIDRNFLGIPTEDWCTSRNAKGMFGPPSFNAAKFSARAGITRLNGSM